MRQQHRLTFFTSLARSLICLALVAPVCDFAEADDESKNIPSTHRNTAAKSVNSNGYYYGLRGRTSADISGVHRNVNANIYHDGLDRTRLLRQNRQRNEPLTGKDSTHTGERTDVLPAAVNSRPVSGTVTTKSNRRNRITGNRVQREHAAESRNTDISLTRYSRSIAPVREDKFKQHNSNSGNSRKPDDESRLHQDRDVVPVRVYSGKNDRYTHQSKTRHDHDEYHNKYSNNKKYIIRRHPVSNIFFTGYSFVPYSYYTYYNYYYPGIISYSPPPYSNTDQNYYYGSNYKRESSGWVQLSNGQIMAALDSFNREINYYPAAGIPKVGYALAVAASGDLTSAILAMREALRNDPDSLQYIYLDEKLLDLVDGLIEKYEFPLQFDNRRPDEAFMVSALYYIEQDFISAHNAIGRAISDGDNSVSVNNLHGIINAKLQENYAGAYNQVH